MTPAQRQMIDEVRAQSGERAVLTDPADLAPWLTDWRGRWHGQSAAILQPNSTADVAAIVSLASKHGVPIVPQGGNTSMVGGATPPADGSALILSLRRMNRIREIDPATASCVAEAGVILQHLHETAAKEGMRFPLTLGARGSATIGGLVSTNAGGTQVLRFGPMRGLIQGLEAVLPDGLVHGGLGGLKKDNRGPSIDQMLIGAEGTMGVVTAARLRLVPAIRSRAVAWLGLPSPASALAVLRLLERETDQIEGFEILPEESLEAAVAHIPGARRPLEGRHRWHALVEAVSHRDDDEAPEQLLARLIGPAIERGEVEDATISSSEAQAASLWAIRDSLSEAERKAFGPATQHDISVPVDAMPAFMMEAAASVESAFPGVKASGFGHLGDGNIHFHVRRGTRGDDSWLEQEGEAVSRLVHDLVTAAGGSISAEHGIGQMKRTELARLCPDRVRTLRQLKLALDPHNLFNPGKLV